VPELLELVAPNQLEEQYGGTAKDKEEGQYWPPSLPDNQFGVGETTDLENLAQIEKAEIIQAEHVLDSEKDGEVPSMDEWAKEEEK
jgi:hypothetical protein